MRALGLALVVTLGALGTPAGVLAAGFQGVCAANNWPSANTGQWYHDWKNATNTFDVVYGWLTDRPLYPCEGPGINYGWSFAAAANVQSDTHGGTYIFQVGIMQVAGQGGDQNYFIRSSSSGSGQGVLISSPRPTFGSRYQFRVYKDSNGTVAYSIRNSAGSVIYSYDTGAAWTSDLNHAWWGWETGNSESMPGIVKNFNAESDLVGQYSYVTSTTVYTRTTITEHSSCPTGCLDDWPGTWFYFGGSGIINVMTSSGPA